MWIHAHTHFILSHGMPEYRCPREVSTALCIHDVECIEPDCSGHGSCDLGECSCDPPWLGEGCERLNCSLTDCSNHGSCTAEGAFEGLNGCTDTDIVDRLSDICQLI